MQTALHTSRTNQADTDFSGLWIPLVTPFDQGQVDKAALKRLVAHYRGSGIAGLVVCGSTGEAAALDEDEQLQTLHTVMAEAPGLPVIMGLPGYHLGKTAARIKALGTLGLAGILLPAPSYIRPSQAGLIEWFTALADVSTVPVILYDIPYRTGSRMDLETILALADHPRIQALKDCGRAAAGAGGRGCEYFQHRGTGRTGCDCGGGPFAHGALCGSAAAHPGGRHGGGRGFVGAAAAADRRIVRRTQSGAAQGVDGAARPASR
jgi:dihydrodipicolinate synthase/N-acetylneuraminate lyase